MQLLVVRRGSVVAPRRRMLGVEEEDEEEEDDNNEVVEEELCPACARAVTGPVATAAISGDTGKSLLEAIASRDTCNMSKSSSLNPALTLLSLYRMLSWV